MTNPIEAESELKLPAQEFQRYRPGAGDRRIAG